MCIFSIAAGMTMQRVGVQLLYFSNLLDAFILVAIGDKVRLEYQEPI